MYSLIARRPTVFDIWDSFGLLDDLDPTRDIARYVRGVRTEEKSDRTEISIDLPGVARDTVDVTVERGLVAVKWTRDGARYSERVQLSFRPGDIEAKLVDGVLTVVAHVPPDSRLRKVAIS